MHKQLIIFGTGNFAQVAHFYFDKDSDYSVAAFCVHEKNIEQLQLFGLPVVPYENLTTLYPPDQYDLFIAVGYKNNNEVRAQLYHDAKSKGYRLATYISTQCNCYAQSIGDNCFIFEDNTIQPFVQIGNNVVLWSGNHIGHHAIIKDHCFLASHVVVSGNVTVNEYTFIGVNATLRDNITIGARNVIGAGTLIMHNTQANELYVEQRTQVSAKSSIGVL